MLNLINLFLSLLAQLNIFIFYLKIVIKMPQERERVKNIKKFF